MSRDRPEERKLATIVFTDIVGSTRLKQELGEREAVARIKRHHIEIRGILGGFPDGEEIETAGDSFFIVFAKPSDAVKFALLVQSRLRAFAQEGVPMSDRIGIHVGEVLVESLGDSAQPRKPSGMHVDTCARVMSMGQGDQILMTRFAFDNARSTLRGEEIEGVGPLSWMNHGAYLLKGVEEAIEICEVGEVGLAGLKPPQSSEKGHRHSSSEGEPVLGWRPALEQAVPGTKWTLEKKLGEGGFGEVWLGRHATLKERRVFKFCFRADRVRSLKREVTLFRVMKEKVGHHPNIVGIQEVFFDEPPFYIVMDYAEGQDLRAWCEAQGGVDKIPLATRLEIVAQVADALQAAHEAGVIHRDVKPSNILVSGQWSVISGEKQQGSPEPSAADSSLATRPSSLAVKLTDFGIGQVVSEEALAGMTKMGFTQTMLGPGSSSHTGTQLYMAPELMAGQPASIGSDIYSLGVVLYQLVIGDFARPLTTDWNKRISDPLLREDLEKCFAGDAHERFASAAELARTLRSLEQRRVELATRERATRRQKLAKRTVVAIPILAAVTGLLILVSRWISPQPGPTPAGLKTVVVMPFRNESSDPRDQYLGDSLTAELIKCIRKVPGLNAIRPPPTMMAKSAEELRALLAQLTLPLLLQSEIQHTGGKIRVVSRLTGTAAGNVLLSETNDRAPKDLLDVPNKLALRIAERSGVSLSAADHQRVTTTPTTNAEAYDCYLRGTFDLQRAGLLRLDVGEAIPMLKRAVALDHRFVAAYAALAEAYINEYNYYKPGETRLLEPKAWEAIQTARKLDPTAPEAHAAAGNYFWTPSQGWQHAKAMEEYQTAFEGDRDSEDAVGSFTLICLHVGLLEKGRELADRLGRINPLNQDSRAMVASASYWQGDSSNAVSVYRDIPDLFFIHKSNFAVALINVGQTNEAMSLIEGALKMDPQDKGGLYASVRAILLAKQGNEIDATNQIARAIERGKGFLHFHHTLFNIASAYALLNKPGLALGYLRDAATNGFPCYPLFAADPNLKSLRESADGRKFLQEQRDLHKEIEDEFAKRPQSPAAK